MRYLPHTDADIEEMLRTIGVGTLEDLFSTIPESCCCRAPLNLPEALTEWELDRHMDSLSESSAVPPDFRIFVGAGRYRHHIPAAVSYVMSRSEFVTAYTPYQPEISQGTLQAIFEYQTLASRLTGMEVVTASHYDGATSLAESLMMAIRITRKNKVAVSASVHPMYRQVVETYFHPTGWEVMVLPYTESGGTDWAAVENRSDLAAIAVQSPNFFGCIEDVDAIGKISHDIGALLVASFTEPLAFGLYKNPGMCGADIACGEGQSLGIPISYGGPGLGMLGSRGRYMRNLPGRLVGRTVDKDGKPGFVLTLATREQHIRREKATSNICTNNSLCALTAGAYMAALGGTGFKELARLNFDKAQYFKSVLKNVGMAIPFDRPTFNEFVARVPKDAEALHRSLLEKNIVFGLPLAKYYPALSDHILLCVTETVSKEDMDDVADLIGKM